MLKNKRLLALTALMFVFSLFIAWCVPYTHDDWDWGRQIGISNWLTGVYNNRFVGTFFVIAMTRSRIFKTLVMALTMTALPLLCTYLSADLETPRKNRVYLCILAYFAVFSMPVITWRQTYGWVAGFSNFTMGAFFLILLLALLKHAMYRAGSHRMLLGAACFFVGFAAQLCAENISIFLPFFLAGAMLLIRFWKRRDLCWVFTLALLGTVLGAVLMFFNPLYSKLAATGVSTEQFRSLTFSPNDPVGTILQTLISLFFGEVLPSLYETHPILVLFLAVGAWIDLFPRRRTAAFCLALPMVLYGIGCCYCASQMRQNFGWLPASAALRIVGAIGFTLLWFLSILLSENPHKWHTLALSLLAVALVAPFCAINHMGPRCYHISHFCLLAAGASHYDHADFKLPGKILVSTALVLTVACLIQAYAAIGACTVLRQELTAQALETQADTLVLPSVDGRYTYSWGYNPQSPLRAEHYREYYGLPADLDLVFLPYGSAELWPDIPEEMYRSAMVYPGP